MADSAWVRQVAAQVSVGVGPAVVDRVEVSAAVVEAAAAEVVGAVDAAAGAAAAGAARTPGAVLTMANTPTSAIAGVTRLLIPDRCR
jgi:hypothetical protein